MWMGPPKALDWPNPMSSISTTRTLGASAGALTSKRGGAVAFRASNTVLCGYWGSGIGSTVRSVGSSTRAGAASWPATGAPVSGANISIRPRANLIERRSIGVSPFVPEPSLHGAPDGVDLELGPDVPRLATPPGSVGYFFSVGVVAGAAGSAAGAAAAAGVAETEDEGAATGLPPGFPGAAACGACAVSLSFACSARQGALSSFSCRLRHCMIRPPEWGTVAQNAWTSGSQSAAEARKSFFNWSRRPLHALDSSPDLSARHRRTSPSPGLMPLQSASMSSVQGEVAGTSAVALGLAAGVAAAAGASPAAGAAELPASCAWASAAMMVLAAAIAKARDIDI